MAVNNYPNTEPARYVRSVQGGAEVVSESSNGAVIVPLSALIADGEQLWVRGEE